MLKNICENGDVLQFLKSKPTVKKGEYMPPDQTIIQSWNGKWMKFYGRVDPFTHYLSESEIPEIITLPPSFEERTIYEFDLGGHGRFDLDKIKIPQELLKDCELIRLLGAGLVLDIRNVKDSTFKPFSGILWANYLAFQKLSLCLVMNVCFETLPCTDKHDLEFQKIISFERCYTEYSTLEREDESEYKVIVDQGYIRVIEGYKTFGEPTVVIMGEIPETKTRLIHKSELDSNVQA